MSCHEIVMTNSVTYDYIVDAALSLVTVSMTANLCQNSFQKTFFKNKLKKLQSLADLFISKRIHVSNDLCRHLASIGGSVFERTLYYGKNEGERRSIDKVNESARLQHY